MHWSHHIQALCKKANKTLNFIRRNLNKCNRSIKASTYLTIIRPLLEYTSCVWDLHQIYLIHDIEKIQRRVARWVMSDYSPYSSVTEMLKLLEWPTLQTRRCYSRLSLFHKIVHHLTPAIQLPSYYLTTQYPTRQFHQYRFIVPATSTTAYQQSYFPKTIIKWNSLSSTMYETSSTEQFINMYLNTTS